MLLFIEASVLICNSSHNYSCLSYPNKVFLAIHFSAGNTALLHFCTALHCTALHYCTALHFCTALHYCTTALLHCTPLLHCTTALHYTTLLHYNSNSILHTAWLHHCTAQCTSWLHCTTDCSALLHYTTSLHHDCTTSLHCSVVQCSVLSLLC